MNEQKCGRCGGWLYGEKLHPFGRKNPVWELTCINCGQTYYPPGQAERKTKTEAGTRET